MCIIPGYNSDREFAREVNRSPRAVNRDMKNGYCTWPWKKQNRPVVNTTNKAYQCWLSMKKRCSNPKAHNYIDYGARGIRVCDRWINSFQDFLSDVGERPSMNHSLERVDANGNYEPGNVIWATALSQTKNRRFNHKQFRIVELEGKYIIECYYDYSTFNDKAKALKYLDKLNNTKVL